MAQRRTSGANMITTPNIMRSHRNGSHPPARTDPAPVTDRDQPQPPRPPANPGRHPRREYAASQASHHGTHPDQAKRLCAQPCRADEFFGARRRGYILWIAPGKDADLENNAVTAGMALRRPAAGAPDMVVTAPLAPVKPPDGVTVIHVTTADQTATFGEIVAGAYAAREEPSPSLHGDSKEAPGVTDDVTGVPAVDGEPQPLAAAMTMFSNPSALLAPEAYAVIACLE